jgi:cytoskeleton protein RodZ
MSEEAAAGASDTAGLRLAAARERAGFSVLQVADKLHLDVSSIQALEAEDFASLGALVYARGHLRRYAELLGLPAAETEAICARAMRLDEAAYLKRIVGKHERAAGRALALPPAFAAVAAVILVVLALIWWAMRVPHAAHGHPPSPASAAGTPDGAPRSAPPP